MCYYRRAVSTGDHGMDLHDRTCVLGRVEILFKPFQFNAQPVVRQATARQLFAQLLRQKPGECGDPAATRIGP